MLLAAVLTPMQKGKSVINCNCIQCASVSSNESNGLARSVSVYVSHLVNVTQRNTHTQSTQKLNHMQIHPEHC